MLDDEYKRVYNSEWDFKDGNMKELTHGIHPYPAMLMPLIARELFERYGLHEETVFLDPFVGSGTTLVEAQRYKCKKAIGYDINPLAILISKVKTTEIDLYEVNRKLAVFKEYIKYNPDVYAPMFSIRDSWFSEDVINNLAIIRYFILTLEDSNIRDFFKVAFSETVRMVSKTRNGEFKLYRMNEKALAKFKPDVFKTFEDIVCRNVEYFSNAKYSHNTIIELHNENSIALMNTQEQVDLVITSPPYGDSHTTVAYGQFSRLSNEWLDMKNAKQIDFLSLGGNTKIPNKNHNISELNEVITKIKENDKQFSTARYRQVEAFFTDYENIISVTAPIVKLGGYAIFIVGNRTVRNVNIPLDVITYKMFEKYGFEHITTYVRNISNKRIPATIKIPLTDTSTTTIPTMKHEYIVIMKKIKKS